MKKTLMNKIASLSLAVMLSTAAFTGCQINGLIEDSSDSETSSKTSMRAAYTEEEQDEIKSLVKDALKEKEEEDKANAKPSKFEYKGYNGAVTKIASYGLEKLINVVGIKNESVLEFVNGTGSRAVAAGTKYLDALLNKATGGLYGVALEILFPEGSSVDPNILKIQDQLTEMEKSISDIQKGIDQLGEDIITSADRTILTTRLNEVSSYRNNFANYAKFLAKKHGSVDYKTYLELKGKLYQMNQNSPEKLMADANTYFAHYNTADRNFGKMYHSVAEASRPWRYQSNNLIRDFINSELSAGTTIYTVMDALFNPDNNGNIYKEALVGYIISNDDGLLEVYNDLMKPFKTSNNFTEINQEKFDYFIDLIDDASESLSDEALNKITADCIETLDAWKKFNEQFDSYVNKIDSIQIVDDKEGQITCNIPGAKYTFSTTMSTVNYGKAFKNFGDATDMENGVWKEKDEGLWGTITYGTRRYDDKALKNSADWMSIFTGSDFEYKTNKIISNNSLAAPEKKVYEKIVNYYKNRGFAVTDGSVSYMNIEGANGKTYRAGFKPVGNVVETTIGNIFRYEAGIEIKVNELAVSSGNNGFVLNKTGTGDWNIVGLHIGCCKVNYIDVNASNLDTKDFSVLDSYACARGDNGHQTLYRSHYYGRYFTSFEGMHEKEFSVPLIISNNN